MPSRIPPAPISAGGWAVQPRHARRTSAPARSRSRNRSGVFSSGASRNCRPVLSGAAGREVGFDENEEGLQTADIADLAAGDAGGQEADVVSVLSAERAVKMPPPGGIMQRACVDGSRHGVLPSALE